MKKSLIILLILMGCTAMGQIQKDSGLNWQNFPSEKTDLMINAELLLAGETLYYKTFVQDGTGKVSSLSKLAYVFLRNEKDSIIFDHKLHLTNGNANGDFFLPATLKTGVYKLISYTNFSRNNIENTYSEKTILLINPFIRPLESEPTKNDIILRISSPKSQIPNNSAAISTKIKLTTDKDVYKTREEVRLQIEDLEENNLGNYVISVRCLDPVNVEMPLLQNSKGISDAIFLPELRGELISGVVLTAENTPVANQVISLTIPGKEYVFKIAKTNNLGHFYFSVDENYQAEMALLQLNKTDLESKNLQIKLDDKSLTLSEGRVPSFTLDPSLQDWILERSVQLQIENAYFEVKRDSVLPLEPHTRFFDNLGRLFVLDDYTRFPSVRETFVEIISLAAIRGGGENARFVVNNEYDPNGLAKFSKIDPLVMVDGFQILNNNELINYDAREIKSIRVINQPYRYGPKLFSGIISVETKSGLFKPLGLEGSSKTFDIVPFVRRKRYFRPTYNDSSNLSRIPDFRVQLLWDPQFNRKPSQSISFFTSDVPGLFQISLSGFTDEGIPISVQHLITVE